MCTFLEFPASAIARTKPPDEVGWEYGSRTGRMGLWGFKTVCSKLANTKYQEVVTIC